MASENPLVVYVGRRPADGFWYVDLLSKAESLRVYLSHKDDKVPHFRQANLLASFLGSSIIIESEDVFAKKVADIAFRQKHNIQTFMTGGDRIEEPPSVPGDPMLAPWQAEKIEELLKDMKGHGE